ncbi:U8 snoRNA-decapping enzyme isoform X2 [Siniperca chuatsi]|uniref:U8 snoRNA-decapping enzyme isoform X2 n=1 Tax=Siniperca chuatsi TaxID=119488 RepID=UPI001CE1CABC|nr:U8 snoRNA-decapping enzyme isoform X2 [Siniperca chuatsi]
MQDHRPSSQSMTSGQLSRAEALACSGYRYACHVMLYSDTKTQLFGRIPIRHIILMQMRFDGLLGFPGGLVNPSEETLEAGLSRELLEELGVALPISVEDHVDSCHAPSSSPSSSSHLITHFYVKKMEEEQIREVERAAVSTATDHGQEVTCVCSRNGQSPALHHEKPCVFPVALIHLQCSRPAG